jgi:hypothetical protein
MTRTETFIRSICQPRPAATAAGIVHGMFARDEYGRSLQNDADCRRVDDSQGILRGFMVRSLFTGGSTAELLVTDA